MSTLAGLTGKSASAAHAMAQADESAPAHDVGSSPRSMPGMNMSHPMTGVNATKPMPAMTIGSATAMNMSGGVHMDLNDVDYDAFRSLTIAR